MKLAEELLSQIIQNSKKEPDKVILSDKTVSLSWRELLHISSFISEDLRERAESAITIIVDRSVVTPCLFLACLMAGKVFVPVSPELPENRKRQILAQLASQSLIDARDINLTHILESSSIKEISTLTRETELLYILFTSGSTGIPKGVKISHRNIMNTLSWSKDFLDWRESDRIGVVAGFSFDISLFDIFSSLYYSVEAYILEDPKDPFKSASEIRDAGITSVFSAPSFFSSMVKYELTDNFTGTSLRRLISGGDFFPVRHIEAWKAASVSLDIFNVWGPTETAIVNTMHKISKEDLSLAIKEKKPVSIGVANHTMMNCKVVDLDSKEVVNDPGKIGEIAVYGESVGIGYLNNEGSKSFDIVDGIPVFYTGDLGYRDEENNLFLTGRSGYMVKVNGYRVDLREVELHTTNHEAVYAAVAMKEDAEDSLWMVVEPCKGCDGEGLKASTLRRHLRGLIPAYMIPKRYFFVEALPMNINGKIDRRAARMLAIQDV